MLKSNAFTMVELLISVLILIILITLSAPSFHALFSQQILLTSTKRLHHFLAFANSQSIKLNQKVYVHFCEKESTSAWRMALSDQTSCDCYVANHCLVNGQEFNQSLSDGQWVLITPSDVTFTGLQASYNAMRFSVNSGSITLNDSYGHRLKVIQSTMRLRICAPDNDLMGYKKC